MITLQLLQQIIVFFLMMACGSTVVKCGLIDAKSSKTLSVICIYIIMPCVMINAFQIEYSRSIRNGFLLAVAAAILIHIFLLVFVQIIGKPLKLSVVEKESIIYSNSGNLVIPLVTVVLGEKWVIYASAFLSVQMILMWTHGQSLMEAKAGINWKKILCNINLIAIILGIVLFFTQIRLPVILGNTMSQISATLGPVCMIMLGMTMTEVKWKDIFSHSRIYLITILKMVVTPLLILLFLKSAIGFSCKRRKNDPSDQPDGSDHTVGNNGCTAGTALRSGTGLCQHHQCNDHHSQYHNHATDGHVVSCLIP